jgi:hypothetical protein
MRFYYLLFIITTSNFHLDIPERGYNEPVKWRFFLNTTHIMTYKWNLNEKTKGERGSFIDKKRGGCPTVLPNCVSTQRHFVREIQPGPYFRLFLSPNKYSTYYNRGKAGLNLYHFRNWFWPYSNPTCVYVRIRPWTGTASRKANIKFFIFVFNSF